MNKADLINKVAEKAGITKKDAGVIVNSMFESITEFLVGEAKKTDGSREKLQITGFGSFFVKDRPARKGVNPRTNEPIDIPKKIVPDFKPGKDLKESVDI